MVVASTIKTLRQVVLVAIVCALTLVLLYGNELADYTGRYVRQQRVNRNFTSVLLLSQCRSGSSILGELFNQRKDVTYLYEPLYPFRESNGISSRWKLVPEMVQAVGDMARCRFDRLPKMYKHAFKVTKTVDREK